MSDKHTNKASNRQSREAKTNGADSVSPGKRSPEGIDPAFLVFTFDDAFKSVSWEVVWAADEDAAAETAMDQLRKENDGDDAGFEVVATLSREQVNGLLSIMDNP
jgi:hypothetical protein